MLKKIGILLLVTIMCLCSMTSCLIEIDDRSGKSTTAVQTEGATYVPPDKIPAMEDVLEKSRLEAEKAIADFVVEDDFTGLSLNVIIAEDTDLNLGASLETSYARALRLQSEIISEKLGCTVYITRTPYTTFLSDAQAALNAGLFYADVVCVPQKAMGHLVTQKLICDLNAVYGDVFVEGSIDQTAKSQASGANKLYGIAGNGTVNPAAYSCVYMNKTVAEACGITDSVYEAVENGSWTLDKMLEFKNSCTEQYEGIVSLTAKGSDIVVESLFGASGMKYTEVGVGALPKVAQNGERMAGFVAKMKGLLADGGNCVCADNAYELFEQGKALFCIDSMTAATSLKGDYTVLPLPKLDEGQGEYFTPADENAYMFVVLTSNNRSQYADTLIKLLNETAAVVNEGWARDLLDYALRNPESYGYVKEVLGKASYDFAYMYGGLYESIAGSSYTALINAVTTENTFESYTGAQAFKYGADVAELFR